MKETLTIKQITEMYNISRDRFDKLRKDNHIKHIPAFGRRNMRFDADKVERLFTGV